MKQLLSLLAVLFAINTSAQTSIINNGDLTGDDMSSFQMKEYGVEPEVVKDAAVLKGGGPDGGNCVVVNSVAKVEYAWDSQFWIVFNEEIYDPAKLKIKFQYKASTKTHISTESHWNPGEYNSGSAIGTLGFTEEWQTFESIISVRPEMTRSDGGSGKVRGFKSIAFTLTKDIDITYYFANFEVTLLKDSPSDDDRTFQMSKVINGVEYALYKQVVDESDIHRNPDGWTSYKSELSLDVTKDGKKKTYIVDDDIYLDTQQGKNGQRPCMMFDLAKRQVYIFCNSKDADESVYSTDGFLYTSSLDKIGFSKELVYEYANYGWWPYFVESEDGTIVINHFSYAGYYNTISKRDINGVWETNWEYFIWPDDYIEQYFQNDEVLVIGKELKLNKTKAVIEKDKTLTLKAKVYPTEEDQSVTWKSSDKKVATVTSAGKVKGVGVGTATITCTSKATGLKATCEVTVGYVKLSKTEACIEKGETMTLKSKVYPTTEDQTVTWKSSNTSIATVTSKGKVKGLKAGRVIITCTSKATGLSSICEVTVGYVKLSKTEVTIEKGKTLTLKSKVYPTTEDQTVTWESSDPTIVKVASTGKIKGMKVGTATITCISNATGLSATCKVTVVKASAAPSMDGSDEDVTGIEEKATLAEEFDVYDLNGRRVLNKATSLDGLSNGVYIVNGKKVVKK